jgi:hypothetical protein
MVRSRSNGPKDLLARLHVMTACISVVVHIETLMALGTSSATANITHRPNVQLWKNTKAALSFFSFSAYRMMPRMVLLRFRSN